MTDCDLVDWGPMKSRTCKWKVKSIFMIFVHDNDGDLQTDCAASALPVPLLSALLSCSLEPPRELRPV